jgi:sigma-B regulation protein RsbU (phosphoserine phosphatase)
MRSLFQSRPLESAPTVEPVRTEFPKIDGAEMAAVFYGKRVAGDFYDALRVSPERILFGLLDVAGRREDNRGILSAAQKIFRDLGTSLFAKADSNESDAMTELCILLNRGIMEAAGDVRSCPAFLGCYHEQLGTLCYTNAGHTPGLVRDNTGISELGPTGLPLGLFSHATSDAPTIGLEKGALLLLVSRGVVEGTTKGGKNGRLEFGLDRVKESLQNNHSHRAEEICAAILRALGEFTSAPPVHDDVTSLAFARSV